MEDSPATADPAFSDLAKPRHFACYDPEWAALDELRVSLGLHTRFDVVRHFLREKRSLRKKFERPRKAKLVPASG